jgi:hypothetical protein
MTSVPNSDVTAGITSKVHTSTQGERSPAPPEKAKKPGRHPRQNLGSRHGFVDASDDAYEDGAIAAEAVKVLNQLAKKTELFFLAVGFYRPHLPFVAPKKYWNLYDGASITLPQHPKPQDAKYGARTVAS